ncbi:MAG: alpha/beta hydrolase [Clostridia bacterium]|nr:alpha/beta hydrolase [Clostridia bacterium]
MKTYTVDLTQEYAFLAGGKLDCILMDFPWDGDRSERDWKRPAVIVVPGGGYGFVSKREGEPVATAFLARGFQTFILTYLIAGDGVRYPEQLLEVSAAVDYVRKHAKELDVNPDEIFVVGFSAGGHLTGNLAVEHQNVSQKAGVALDCKPTAVGLCYPVISKIHGHQGSYENLLNGYTEEAQAELLKTLNLNEAVSKETPPAFIWATAEDNGVPADNALRYALALADKEIAYELHVYPQGWHGLSTASKEINGISDVYARVPHWLDDCAAFFRLYVKEPF